MSDFLEDLAAITRGLNGAAGMCAAQTRGPLKHAAGMLTCSLDAGHDGDHVAKGGPDLELHRWTQEDA